MVLSKTGLGRIFPFYNDNPPNEAMAVTFNNGIVYVGTLNDNGLVFGLDCSNPAVPRIVSIYAYGTAILSWSGELLFNGTELFVGGGLNGSVYPVTQVNMSEAFDSINQYFPPAALQDSPQPLVHRTIPALRKTLATQRPNRFHR